MKYYKYLIAVVLNIFLSLNSWAENNNRLDIIDVKACQLQAPEGYLDGFWNSCISQKDSGPIPVLHLGDSHVQGGFFSDPIRRFFDHYFGLAGLGWVAPYSFVRSNQPFPSKVVRKNGTWSGSFITSRHYNDSPSPTGITLTAVGKGVHEMEFYATNYFPISKAVIFRDASTPALFIKGEMPKNNIKGIKELPIADTLELKLETSSLTLLAPQGARWYGVSLESSNSGVLVHTIGYNGAFYSSFNQEPFLKHLPLFKPKLILLSLGTNDMLVNRFSMTELATNVRSFIIALKSSLPGVVIILTSPCPAFKAKRVRRGVYVWGQNNHVGKVSKVLEQEAKKLRCGYIDVYSGFPEGVDAEILQRSGILSRDGVHLTKEGYDILGSMVSYALLNDFRRYLKKNRPSVVRR